MNILFVCRHNRFRSKFAEAYFNKINKNPNLKVRSAGIFPGTYPLDKLEVKVSKKLGVEIKGIPKPITTRLLRWNDLIVSITNDLPNTNLLFNYGDYKNNLIDWEIEDNNSKSEERIKKILLMIKNKVENLIKQLEN